MPTLRTIWKPTMGCLLAMLLLSVAARADDATGTVTGTVTKDGAPAVNAKVLVFKAGERKARAAKGSGTTTAGGPTAGTADGAAKTRPQPLMTSTTDGNGKFTLTLPAGEYVIIAGEKGEGRGHQRISVTAGQATSVNILLTPREAQAKHANGKTT